MTPPPVDATVAFAIWAGAAIVGGVILRIRRDITGPPLSSFAKIVWMASLVGIGVMLLLAWLVDLSDRWLMWPAAAFGLGCLVLILWDTARAIRRTRRQPS